MKSVDVKSNIYSDSSKEIDSSDSSKDPKFKIGDFVRISKYKFFLQKFALQIGLKKFL